MVVHIICKLQIVIMLGTQKLKLETYTRAWHWAAALDTDIWSYERKAGKKSNPTFLPSLLSLTSFIIAEIFLVQLHSQTLATLRGWYVVFLSLIKKWKDFPGKCLAMYLHSLVSPSETCELLCIRQTKYRHWASENADKRVKLDPQFSHQNLREEKVSHPEIPNGMSIFSSSTFSIQYNIV